MFRTCNPNAKGPKLRFSVNKICVMFLESLKIWRNICGANVSLFFFFFSYKQMVHDIFLK